MPTRLRFKRLRPFLLTDTEHSEWAIIFLIFGFNIWYIRRAEDDVPSDLKETGWKGVEWFIWFRIGSSGGQL
jgi:hypothetical protein